MLYSDGTGNGRGGGLEVKATGIGRCFRRAFALLCTSPAKAGAQLERSR